MKKDTEYAKKLILNEKKIDSLLSALDKSREDIVRTSILAYEDN